MARSSGSKDVNVNNDSTAPLFVQQVASTTPSTSVLSYVSGTKNSSGNNTLIAAPGANIRIVLVSIVLQNQSSTATTMKLQDDTGGTEILQVLGQNQGDGLVLTFPADARPKLTANKLLNLNLSGANTCSYSIFYYTE